MNSTDLEVSCTASEQRLTSVMVDLSHVSDQTARDVSGAVEAWIILMIRLFVSLKPP